MSKPTKYPEWASSGTNIIEPPAAQKSEGYVNAAQPSPKRLNWILNLIYQWIQYLDERNTTPQWRWQIPLGRESAEIDISWSGNVATVSGGAGLLDGIRVHVGEGDTITGLGARVFGTGSGSVTVNLIRSDGTTVKTLSIPSPAATWTTYTATISPGDGVPAETGYHIEVEMSTVGQKIALVGVQVAGPA